MKLKPFILVLSLFLLACGINPVEETKQQEIEESKELAVQKEVKYTSVIEINEESTPKEEQGFVATTARIAKNEHNCSLTISDNYGVYVISQPGAMPKVEHVYQLDVKSFSGRVVFEELPQFSCESHQYNKRGCFAQEINPLHESQLWNYTGMNEKEKQAVNAQAETIKYTVVDTENNIKYYFSEIEDNWYLTFVDFRTPCEA